MDRKALYEKAEKAINQAFEVTKKSVAAVSEKAGEAAHITKLLIDKVKLEHRVTKQFTQLGSRVYEKALQEGKSGSFQDAEIKGLIDETKKLSLELAQVEATIETERRGKQSKR